MTQLGADVDRLDALGGVFSSHAGRLQRTASSLTTAINGADWHGPDVDRFRAAWRTEHSPCLTRLANVLGDLGTALRKQAAEQRTASAPDSAAPAGHPLATPTPAPDPDGDSNNNGWPDWLENSPLRFLIPEGPKYLHSGDDSPWTQQGQGYDPTRDEILTTYYDQDDDAEGKPDLPGILLSIQDRTSGSELTNVLLVGKDGTGGPLHGGGVATDGDYVYVTGGDTVWVYSRDDIDAAGDGQPVKPLYEYQDVLASSFTTIHDGKLYVGSYENGEEGSLYSYQLGPNGTLLGSNGQPRPEQSMSLPYLPGLDGGHYEGPTPHNSQGVEIYKDGFLFTQSHGDDDPSDLLYQPFGSDTSVKIGELSALSQGLNVIGDKLYITSEASSYQFDVPDAPESIDVFDLDDFDLDEIN